MAAEDVIGGLTPNVNVQGLITGTIWVIGGLLIAGLLAYLFYYYTQKKRYGEYEVAIWEKDGVGNIHETLDNAGVFLDKETGLRLCFLKDAKKGLNPNNIPYISVHKKIGAIFKRKITIKKFYIQKVGVSNYKMLHMKLLDDGTIIKVGEEDINWAYQDIEKIKKQYGTETFWNKYGAQIAFIIVMMIAFITLMYLFNKFDVLKDIAVSLQTVADTQLEITRELRNVTQLPQLNPGQPIIVANGG